MPAVCGLAAANLYRELEESRMGVELLALAARSRCGKAMILSSPIPVTVVSAFEAMRCRFEFVLVGADEPFLLAAAEEAQAEVTACEARLSAFSPGSLLSCVNREAAERWVAVDMDTFSLLLLAMRVWKVSGGGFDPTIGPLLRSWGLRSRSSESGRGKGDNAEGADDIPVGMNYVELDEARCAVRFLRPGIELDLGGIAKGHGLDLAAASLRDNGVTSALLHGGTSSVVAIGSSSTAYEPAILQGTETSRVWRVQVAAPPETYVTTSSDTPTGPSEWDPRHEGLGIEVSSVHHSAEDGGEGRGGSVRPGPLCYVDLSGAALGVSAPHGRLVRGDKGELLGHIISPLTRRPVMSVAAAAAVCDTAAEADAWSTAMVALDGSQMPTIAQSAGPPLRSWLVRPRGERGTVVGPDCPPGQRNRLYSYSEVVI